MKKSKNKTLNSPDFTNPDVGADKTGTDNDADKTVGHKSAKSKIESDPDTTGIDTKADKTKKETFPDRKKNK
jgi:hypothetical protein